MTPSTDDSVCMAVSVGMTVLRVTVLVFDTQVTTGGGVLSVRGGLELCSVCERDFRGVCQQMWVHEKGCVGCVCKLLWGLWDLRVPLCERRRPVCCSL